MRCMQCGTGFIDQPPLCDVCRVERNELNKIIEEYDKQQRNPDAIVTNKE